MAIERSGPQPMISADQVPFPTIAIVGMDCCLPGAANLAQFEQLLLAGKSGVAELPAHRFERDLYFDSRRGQPGKTYTVLGGTVPDLPVNIGELGLSAKEAELVDPVHLRFSEVAVRAWKNAGFSAHDPQWRRTGVFVGHSGATQNGGGLNLATQIEEGLDFLHDLPGFQSVPIASRKAVLKNVADRIRESRPRRVPGHVPNYQAYTAASLPARVLGLDGPRVVCDAACASSLFAMQQAITAIQLGRIDAAIVGGATTNGVDNLILFSQSQACSDKGSCPFDNSASGLISSEGYAAVVVVPHATAVRLNLPVLGVISGLGIASDGRGKSLWAPRAEGQQLAISRAYPEDAPLQIDYLEAHATSTQLGDATELHAVHALRKSKGHAQPLLIGSLKSNLGHTLETAGVAGLIKILLAMRNSVIPCSLNYRKPNQSFDWSSGTVQVVQQQREWKPQQPAKRAAVSAFGIGGLNAHLFVQSHHAAHAAQPAVSRLPAAEKKEPIAIIGRGVILPGAHQLPQFRELLASGRTEIGAPPADRWRPGIGVQAGAAPNSFQTPTAQGGFIRDYVFDSQSYRIPPKQVKQANPLQMMLLDAVTQAIGEVDQGKWNFDKQKTGVVIGTIFSGDFGSQLQLGLRLPEISRELSRELSRHGLSQKQIDELLQAYRQLVLASRPALLDETGSFTASTLASRIAKTFDLMGGACAIDVDDASGLAALSLAVDQLRAGTWEVAICGAAERAMDLSKFEQLDLTGKLVRSGRPADIPEHCEQILPGEGAVILMLERLSVAQAAGHRIYGIIEDVENLSPSTSNSGNALPTLQRDRELARQVGYLTGAQSLVQLLKQTISWEASSSPTPTAVPATKICSRTEDGIIYQLNCRALNTVAPDEQKQIAPGPRGQASQPVQQQLSRNTEVNMDQLSNGQHLSPAPRISSRGSSAQVYRYHARSAADLISLITQAGESAQSAVSHAVTHFDLQRSQRVAVLADSPAQLQERLGAVKKQLQRGRTRGVFETERAILWQAAGETPRVVWAFPGQGSQYAGAPAALTHSAAAQQKLAEIDQILQQLGLEPLTPRLNATTDSQMSDIWWNQLWVLANSLALTAELKSLGHRPDLVLGHSFGEYSALSACGSLNVPQVIRMVRARANAVSMTVREAGQLISVRATPNAVESLLRSAGSSATITHFNAPQQTVIATCVDQVDAVRKMLSTANLASVPVAVPVAYHTSRLAAAEEVLRNTFSHERFLPATCGFMSTTTVQYLAEPRDLKQTLVGHLTSPVLYVPAVERLLADGFGVFIEVGPNQILSRLNNEIAGDRALCVSFDLPGRDHNERLLLVQAALEIAGLEGVTAPSLIQQIPTNAAAIPVAPATPPAVEPAMNGSAHAAPEVEIVDLRRSRRKEAATEAPRPATNGHAKAVPSTNGHGDPSIHHNGSSNGHLPVATAASPAPASAHNGPSLQEVQNFLLTVVVDLTGYSPDVIDFDADLEADLGVDSIKKAQVVGELAECFELSVAPSGITMADLRTLADIAAIGVQYGTSRNDSTNVVTPAPAIASVRTNNQAGEAPETPVAAEVASQNAAATTGLDLASIERFLIDLVVDQTGYSPDVVDLDADMEGDLGIDSIKQAQLLGEVQQQFELPVGAGAGKSLTSFSTLRSILNFLAETLPIDGSAAFRVEVDEPAAPGELPVALKKNGLVSHNEGPTGYGSTISEPKPTPAFTAFGLNPSDEIPVASQQLFASQAVSEGADLWTQGWHRGQQHAAEIRGALRLLIDQENHSTATIDLAEETVHELSGLAAGAGVSLPAVLHAHTVLSEMRKSRPVAEARHSVSTQPRSDADSVKAKSIATQAEKDGPQLKSDQSMRFAMRIARAPQRGGMPHQPQFSGPALVIGNNPISHAIRSRFEQEGRNCHIVPACASLEELNAWLNQLWSTGLTPHVFITTCHDADALQKIDARSWQQRRFSAVEVPYRVCQLWMQRMIDAGKMDGASVVAVLNLGGDFGFSGETCISPEGGIGGLIKAMLIEAWMRGFRATPMKVIDLAPSTSAEQAIEGIWRELAIPSYDMEVALHGTERFAIQPVFKPLDERPAEFRKGQATRVTAGGTWVVTGGARGITAVVVQELAKRHGLKLHLLGTAPAPNVSEELRLAAVEDRLRVRRAVMAEAAKRNENGMEAWRNVEKALEIDSTLRHCHAQGIDAKYHCCDVSDLERLEATLQRVREIDGPIAGVIHGAGIGQDARFDRKRPDKVDQCLRAKIDGCINLMDATRQDPLESFIAFGSISGRFGANGHTDYSYANDSLAKLVGRYRRERPEVASVTFHWHAWGDIGMATKPETKLALEMINLEFMPAKEGIEHFLNELEIGGEEPEVLITDRAYYRKFFPIDRNVMSTDPAAQAPVGFPLLDPEGDLPLTHGGPFAIELNPEKERFLNQHLVQGKPTLPFVVALELMAEAARTVSGKPIVREARNVEALQAIKWSTSAPMTIHVRTNQTTGGIECALIADVRRRDGRIVAKDKTYFQGSIITGDHASLGKVTRPDLSRYEWEPIQYLDATAPIYHGPDMQCLQFISLGEDEAFGQISASSTVQLGGGHRPTYGWSVHCAAMDACLYAAALFAGRKFGRASLPVRFERIQFSRLPDPGEPCLVHIKLNQETPEGLILAFQLIGLNGEILLNVEGYHIGWLL